MVVTDFPGPWSVGVRNTKALGQHLALQFLSGQKTVKSDKAEKPREVALPPAIQEGRGPAAIVLTRKSQGLSICGHRTQIQRGHSRGSEQRK